MTDGLLGHVFRAARVADQNMEHAVMHPVRHTFQLRELMEG
jgi:hypothetical protein